jgi:undecaprenyl-diphosphatase
LRAEHVVVDRDGGVHIVEFGAARVAASDDDRLTDVAELCASLSQIVPAARVATSAARVLGRERLAAVLVFLQPLRLTPLTRRRLAERTGLLQRVRAEVAAAAGCEAPPVVAPARVAARNLVALAGALFAINLLLPQVAQAHATVDALRHTRWMWLVAAIALSAVTYLMAAVALLGAVGRRLALGRTWAVQLAAAFTNRLAPAGLGGMATNVRYLEAAGTPRPAAIAALGLDSAAGFVVHALALVVVVPFLGSRAPGALHFSTAELPERWPVLAAVVGVLVVLGAAVRALRLHRRLVALARAGVVALRAALMRPGGAAALFGGSVGVTAGYALALVAATRAFGVSTGVAAIVAVYLGGSAIASVAPTPGGLGALEAALVAGLTAAGAAPGPAVAAVLAYRLVTFWLPIVPGFVAYRALRRSAVL